jgi:tetratricopeptide (TPR) repeat protein
MSETAERRETWLVRNVRRAFRRDAETPPSARRDALALAAIAVLGLLSYGNAFHAAFAFDDYTNILKNPLLRDLGNYLLGPAGYEAKPSRYVAYLTFALNYALGGLDPRGYHALNVAVHLVNAGLVYGLALLTFGTPRLRTSRLAPWSGALAFVASALFAAHPLQTEAVTYVVQRVTSLAAMLYLLALVQYVGWRLAAEAGNQGRAGGVLRYALAIATAVAAMRTKEIAFTWPATVFLYELIFFGRPTARRVAWLVPVAATALVIPLTFVRFDTSGAGALAAAGKALSAASEATRVQTTLSRWDYLTTQLSVIATYLRLLVLPVGQNLDYEYPVYHSLLEPHVIASLALLGALAGAALALLRARPVDPAARLVAFGILWFFLTISVESSLIPIVDVIAEHRVYLPSAGLFVAAVTAAALLATRTAAERGMVGLAAGGLAVALVLGGATFARNRVWADEVSLWSDVVAKSPGKSRPHCNLGGALGKVGRPGEAIAELREAIRLEPGYVEAYNNLGVALAEVGARDEGIATLEEGIRIDPGHADTYYNLGRVYATGGRYGEAVALFEAALRLRPDYAEAYANLGAALNRAGRPTDAIEVLQRAAPLLRDSAEAQFNLGVAYTMLRNRPAAEAQVRTLDRMASPLAAQLASFIAKTSP